MKIEFITQLSRRACPVRDKMLVENEMHPPCPPVPSGTECGNIHCVPDGTQGLWNHLLFYQHNVPNGTDSILGIQ
jgi:hypothetical protein